MCGLKETLREKTILSTFLLLQYRNPSSKTLQALDEGHVEN